METGTKRKIYIAGPMTGLEQFNYPAFEAARGHLTELGWDAKSPTESGVDDGGVPGSVPYAVYFKAGVKLLLECDAIAMLPGWTWSSGAKRELMIAHACGMNAFSYLAGRRHAPLSELTDHEIRQVRWPA